MITNLKKVIFSTCASILLSSCVASPKISDLTVDHVFVNRAEYDLKKIRMVGNLEFDTNVINIVGSDKEKCVGLLLTRNQIDRFKKKSGKQVVLQGIVEANGCSGNNICYDHLCRPALLTNVKLLR